ncbi:ABC transporter ATP-binding protein [Desulfitobacterium sp. THU1]|uniref:ABC transporter ATP-binding protein n=1 Tax=Desulfitobacterium sp. THU1 TaxID=3138072 RepID=UPI00311F19BB
MPKIILKEMTKAYEGNPAIARVSLEIEDGELLALVGHSGCGKTTLLRLISGLTAADQGHIWIDGVEVTGQKAEERDVVMVFQENLLFPHLTVAENIAFGLKMQKVPRKKRTEKTKEMLELMQLPNLGKRYPAELSGGQQQRVALARALALEPKVLLLDEPLSNLDPKLRDELRELILRLHRELQMTTVLVTHDRDEAMMMADRIAVLYYGKLLQVDQPVNIYRYPAAREVASLFGQCNFIPGLLKDGEFQTEDYRFTVPALKRGGRVEACIRSEHIKIARPQEDRPTGVILEKKYLGGQGILKIGVGNLIFVARGNNYFDLDIGNQVSLDIDWSQVSFTKGDHFPGDQTSCG